MSRASTANENPFVWLWLTYFAHQVYAADIEKRDFSMALSSTSPKGSKMGRRPLRESLQKVEQLQRRRTKPFRGPISWKQVCFLFLGNKCCSFSFSWKHVFFLETAVFDWKKQKNCHVLLFPQALKHILGQSPVRAPKAEGTSRTFVSRLKADRSCFLDGRSCNFRFSAIQALKSVLKLVQSPAPNLVLTTASWPLSVTCKNRAPWFGLVWRCGV